jgi:PKD repeat protein
MKRSVLFAGVLFLVAIALNSCKKDPPVSNFTYVADGLTVTFTSTATNTSTYLWDFGDGGSSTEANPVHVYVGGGAFEVKLTVTGEGGTDYKKQTVTVVVSLGDVKNMLSGGSGSAAGKTWIMKTTSITAGDGASAVNNDMVVLIPTPADFYGWLGSEKDNEFTFKYDGSYSINPKNDSVLSISLFAFLNSLPTSGNGPYGTCMSKYTIPASMTYELHETDFSLDAITNPSDATTPPAHATVNFTGKKWLSFSAGSFFGILDWTTNSHVMIESISPTEMRAAIIVCMYAGAMNPGGATYANLPTHIYHITYIPK